MGSEMCIRDRTNSEDGAPQRLSAHDDGGEPLTGRITIGGIAILAAMALVVRPPRRRRGAPQHHTEPPVVQVDPAWATRFGTDRML